MPRGLYAMIMTFKDDVPGQQTGPLYKLASSLGKNLFASEKLDINQTVAKYSSPDPDISRLKKELKDIRLTSGRTHGQIELPEAADLVFPDLDQAAKQALAGEGDGGGKGKGKEPGTREKFKNAGTWVQDYLDRRGQAFYVSHALTSIPALLTNNDTGSRASRLVVSCTLRPTGGHGLKV